MVLELFINREGFVEDAEKLLMEVAQSQEIEVYVTDKCLKRIRLELGDTDDQLGEQAAYKVEAMLNGRIIQIDRSIREQARTFPLRDFDSAEELACATAMQLDAIVTQNSPNFDGATLTIWSVEDLLKRLQLEKNLETTSTCDLFASDLAYIPVAKLSNHDLILRCQAELRPDRAAFAELIYCYQSQVDRILYYLAPDWSDRVDLAQEVWIRVYRNINRLQEPSKFRDWLSRIATNLFYDELRKRKQGFGQFFE